MDKSRQSLINEYAHSVVEGITIPVKGRMIEVYLLQTGFDHLLGCSNVGIDRSFGTRYLDEDCPALALNDRS